MVLVIVFGNSKSNKHTWYWNILSHKYYQRCRCMVKTLGQTATELSADHHQREVQFILG